MATPFFLLLALGLTWVPLPPPVLSVLFGGLLVSQVAVAALALLRESSTLSEVRVVGLLNDAVLLFAVLLAAAVCREGNPWPGTDQQGLAGLVAGLAGNFLYLRAMLHHQKAHELMEQEFEERLPEQTLAVEADLHSGLLSSAEAARKLQQLSAGRSTMAAICALGRQAGGRALLQLACLAVALSADPSVGVFVAWAVGVALPGLVNSKAQDFLLYPYVPRESRLC